MGERKIDITDDSRGISGNRIIGRAYIDDENGKITFTDNSNGVFGDHIIGHGYIDKDSGETTITDDSKGVLGNKIIGHIHSDNDTTHSTEAYGVGGGRAGAGGLGFAILVLVILSIYVSWHELITGFSEFPVEGIMWIVVAVISFIAAFRVDFMAGISASVLVGSVIEIFRTWNGMEGVLGKITLIIMTPIIFAGFGVVPSALASVIKRFTKK